MKKLILFAAILFAGVSVVKAQGETTTTTTTTTTTENEKSTLTVRLKPYQTISVEGNAEIVFDSKDDYSATEKQQTAGSNVKVSISSAGGFDVKVYAADLVLTGGDSKKIAINNIQVLATAVAGSLKNIINSHITLKNEAGLLISSESGKIATSYDLAFQAMDGELFRAAFDGNGSNTEEQVYTTTVYYEIAAK